MKYIIGLIFISYSNLLFNQDEFLKYRSSQNPQYWKNRMPFEGYWQQDVYYNIKARIHEKTNIISATEKLVYVNNSPDELTYVYFHLYQNAFQPGSYCDALHKANNYPVRWGKYEAGKKGTEVLELKINGVSAKTELDNTILKVYLPKPLKSGESVEFDIVFKTYFDTGNIRRRMKTFPAYGFRHYDGVHWYPRIAVYDRKFGWTTDQHLGKEFYGDFGVFNVELTFSSNYVVEATGKLVNEKEVLPDSLRKKLDISNFKNKPWGEKPSIITAYDSTQTKTWKYLAEDVHDFAFTADPTYRIGETQWNGVRCISIVQEPHASGWQNAADYTAKIIQTFSEDFGMYAYPKMVVADAQDGMEYPMLTLDGGSDPGYRDLLVHEIAHNWFFGMVGSNETYRAFLDEGFTQFLTSWGLEKIDGDTVVDVKDKNTYARKFRKERLVREDEVFYGYLSDAIREIDAPLNTHSDDFNSALRHGGGYRHVYFKTATMLYNLQYVLGDELFQNAMQHYFNQWKMAHPYPEDFRNSIIQFTKVDLNWFFDQWLETTKSIDYSIESVNKTKNPNEYKITFKRKGTMQMPLDFTVISDDEKEYNFHVPNNWFVKNTDAFILPRWIGWGKLNPTYDATISIPGNVQEVVIDPTHRLADINRLNNSNYTPIEYHFDSKIANYPSINNYDAFVRPELWYNAFDGLKLGIHMNGNYMRYLHNVDATIWFNTGILQQKTYFNASDLDQYNLVSYRFRYQNTSNKLVKNSYYSIHSRFLDGLRSHAVNFYIPFRNEKSTLGFGIKSMLRPKASDLLYLIYPFEWNENAWNNTLNIYFNHSYRYAKGIGKILLTLKSSSILSDYNYAYFNVESVNETRLNKLNIKTRVFGQLGTGSLWAPESQLFLAQANPEEMMENKFVRSTGFIDPAWTGFGIRPNHLHVGGGLNIRGYSGYLAPEVKDSVSLYYTYKGTSGLSFNGEVEFDKYIPLKFRKLSKYFKLNTYVFGDVGIIDMFNNSKKFIWSGIRASGGVGTALTIKKFGPLETVQPLTLRFDVPLFLNSIPFVDQNYVQYRWIVGVSRAF